jgi:hypothetical protein
MCADDHQACLVGLRLPRVLRPDRIGKQNRNYSNRDEEAKTAKLHGDLPFSRRLSGRVCPNPD